MSIRVQELRRLLEDAPADAIVYVGCRSYPMEPAVSAGIEELYTGRADEIAPVFAITDAMDDES